MFPARKHAINLGVRRNGGAVDFNGSAAGDSGDLHETGLFEPEIFADAPAGESESGDDDKGDDHDDHENFGNN